jgi:hypothetical protein
MSRLSRYTQQIFGSGAGSNQIAEFGSLAAASPATYSGTTITPTIVQSLSNYLSGWFGAVIGGNSPAIEDMNAICYLYAYQLAYVMQLGIAEWDAGTTYYVGSIAQDGTGNIYASLTNSNTNNALSSTANWKLMVSNPFTTLGDISYSLANGVPARLGGNTTAVPQVLTSTGSGSAAAAPSWVIPGDSFVSQSSALNPAVINTKYLLSGSAFNITLPDATTAGWAGKPFFFQHNGSNFVGYTFLTTGGQTINGPGGTVSSGNYAMYTNGEKLVLYSDGFNWQVAEHETITGWSTLSTIAVTSTGAHSFTIASSSVTAGAVYSTGGNNYIASATIVSTTTMLMSGTGTPGASGTLTKVSGTGPATIAYSAVSNSAPVKGSTSLDQYMWRRLGDSVEFWYQLVFTGTGSNGTGDYVFDFSSIGSFGASVLIALPTVTALGSQGSNTAYSPYRIPASGFLSVQAGNQQWVTDIVPYSPSSYKIEFEGGSNNGFVGNALDGFGSQVGFSLKAVVQVLGWQP